MPVPTSAQALSFYRAALATARFIDPSADPRTLDRDADAAWKAYGDDLPAVVRCDLVLRNFAMLYPAAFAPGPVFGLSGWYEDSPWGAGFDRPSPQEVGAIFQKRTPAATTDDVFVEALEGWGVTVGQQQAPDPRIAGQLNRATNVVVSGTRAMHAVARCFAADERLSVRAQVLLVSGDAPARQLLGMVCAMRRDGGVPLLADLRLTEGETRPAWAEREKRRLAIAQARLFVVSSDAPEDEREAASVLAGALGASERVDVVEA